MGNTKPQGAFPTFPLAKLHISAHQSILSFIGKSHTNKGSRYQKNPIRNLSSILLFRQRKKMKLDDYLRKIYHQYRLAGNN